MNFRLVLPAMALMLALGAHAMPSAENSDAVLPNSPLKERGFPDAGLFNPVGSAGRIGVVVAPAAMTYYTVPPATVLRERAPRPYALVAAPTLPCAPGYCPVFVRVRQDRN